MTLTNLEIKNAKLGMHADGSGLYLYVKGSGSKSWIFRYQIDGRRREMGLGALTTLPAVAARAEAARLKALVAQKQDPLELRKHTKALATETATRANASAAADAATFRVVAERYLRSHESAWRNAKHRQQWENTLQTYAYPVIGKLPVRDVVVSHIVQILEPIWSTKSETASRVRMRIEAVLDSAKLMGWRAGENPAVWRGGLEAALPRISKVKRVRHHPALPWRQIAEFMTALRDREGISPRAVELLILTAARSGEIRHAGWREVDLENRLWVIPAERMKSCREHRVPLSQAAARVIEGLPKIDGCPLLFPGFRNRALSDMSLAAVLKRMKCGGITVHGFRSTFREWAAEETDHSGEAVEMALAHSIKNKVEAAYRRGDMLQKRRPLMEEWAAYCGYNVDLPADAITADQTAQQASV